MKNLTLRHALAAVALISLTVLGTGVGTAHAAWSECAAPYNCWFSGSNGSGHKWQVKQDNRDLRSYGITTQSGWNRKYPYKACGYAGIEFSGGANYGRPYDDKESYSPRVIKSNRFLNGTCFPSGA